MSKNIIFVLMYHRHNLFDLMYTTSLHLKADIKFSSRIKGIFMKYISLVVAISSKIT
jgi:hypothetical protein